MDKVLFAVCMLVYGVAVISLVFKTKAFIAETPTVPNKLYAAACAIIYIASFLYFTSTIKEGTTIAFRDMSGGPFSIGAIVGYGFMWFVFFVLHSAILTTLLFLPYTVYIFAKYPNVTWRTKLPDYMRVDVWPSMYVAGASLAYELILYAFSLTDVFNPLWFT